MEKSKFYQYSLPQPFHVSVGAVLFNDDYEICVHHFYKKDMPEKLHFLGDYLDDYYHLMRESLEGNEPLQDAVLRGIQEEFGAMGAVEKYLGPKLDVIRDPDGSSFEKLTLYHAVRLGTLGERPNSEADAESHTVMEWHLPEEALALYDQQVALTVRPELDERIIIRRFMNAYGIS